MGNKVKEKDLVIGDEYWFDNNKIEKGIFVGIFDELALFYPTSVLNNYHTNDESLVDFDIEDYEYEEV